MFRSSSVCSNRFLGTRSIGVLKSVFTQGLIAIVLMAVSVAHGQAYSDLHDFGGLVTNANGELGEDGYYPLSGITFDASGNMYGTASDGGAIEINGTSGMLWELTTSGTYIDLHDFGGTITNAGGMSVTDGFAPEAGIAFDASGNIYGTTYEGGAYGGGIVWELTKSGTYIDLHDFGGTITNANGKSGRDGTGSEAGVTFDASGNMYGTASAGGPNEFDPGIVWELTKSGAYIDLHDFGGTVTDANGNLGPDGANPAAGITFDASGNMYGTAANGGPNVDPDGNGGMLWELTTSGTYLDLHDFGGTLANSSSADGIEPEAGITFDASGNIYGTTYGGGAHVSGIVWELAKSGAYIDLHDFGGTVVNANGASGPDGAYPEAGIAFDASANIYGTTYGGGAQVRGTVWELTQSGNYVDLHDFGSADINANNMSAFDGHAPASGITFDSAGNMYGTATYGGDIDDPVGLGMLWVIEPTITLLSMSLASNSLTGGNSTSGTVTLSGPSQFATFVALSSSSQAARVPAAVPIPAGASSASFTLKTTAVGATKTTTITANVGDVSMATSLTIFPPPISSVTIDPSSVPGGKPSQGVVTLGSSSSYSGVVVKLSSSSPSARMPSTVTVQPGKISASFEVTTTAVATNTPVTITATNGSNSASGTLTVLAPVVESLHLDPDVVTGGSYSTATVTLDSPAPAGGLTVNLSSSLAAATVPATVTVAAGKTGATFTVNTAPVSATVSATIKAAAGSSSKSENLVIVLPKIKSFTVTPNPVIGGQTAVGEIILTGPAPAGGTTCTLQSFLGSVTVPATVTIAAGKTAVKFKIATTVVTTNTNADIKATCSGASQTVQLTLTGP